MIFWILIWRLIFVFPFHKERPAFPPVLEIFIKFSNCKDSRKSRIAIDGNQWTCLNWYILCNKWNHTFSTNFLLAAASRHKDFFPPKKGQFWSRDRFLHFHFFLLVPWVWNGRGSVGKPWCHTPQSTNQNSKNLNPHSPDEAEKQSVLKSLHLTTRYAAKWNVLDQFKQFWIFNVKWDKLKIWI